MKTSKENPHTLFYRLLSQMPGTFDRESMKEVLVEDASGGRTTSLSELYQKYPQAYSEMIERMKKLVGWSDSDAKADEMDRSRKRVIAAICHFLDERGMTFATARDKVAYAISVACRAANCASFNQIPATRLGGIYSAFSKRNAASVEATLYRSLIENISKN